MSKMNSFLSVCKQDWKKLLIGSILFLVGIFLLVNGSMMINKSTKIKPSNVTEGACFELSYTSEWFGYQCYESGFIIDCPDDPCYCFMIGYQEKCLSKPNKVLTHYLIGWGVTQVIVSVLTLIMVCVHFALIYTFRTQSY